jgi:hypothetical protein
MPVEMAMWRMTAGGPQRLEASPLELEGPWTANPADGFGAITPPTSPR